MYFCCIGTNMRTHCVIHKSGSTYCTAIVNMCENCVKFGRAVSEICEQTERQTDIYRHAECNTLHLYQLE